MVLQFSPVSDAIAAPTDVSKQLHCTIARAEGECIELQSHKPDKYVKVYNYTGAANDQAEVFECLGATVQKQGTKQQP